MMIRARTRTQEPTMCSLNEINNCARVCLLRVHACTDHQENKYAGFKFYGDPFVGCREIAETILSMHIYQF